MKQLLGCLSWGRNDSVGEVAAGSSGAACAGFPLLGKTQAPVFCILQIVRCKPKIHKDISGETALLKSVDKGNPNSLICSATIKDSVLALQVKTSKTDGLAAPHRPSKFRA
jgi:hypothetical protein